jgi:ferric-dicitrate binding protein FerR (iron transport regulator)
MNYDEKIQELQRQKVAKKKADRDAEKQADRRAFWRKIALMAVLSAAFLCLLMASGMLR